MKSVAMATGKRWSKFILHCENVGILIRFPKKNIPMCCAVYRPVENDFKKEESILNVGDCSQMTGVVISGVAEVAFYDENGNQINVNHLTSGEVFGVELACSDLAASPVQLRAITDCEVLLLNMDSLFDKMEKPCPYKMRVATNLLRIFARQTMFLNLKLRIMGQKRLRDKLKVYLQSQRPQIDGTIVLPYNRNELANFLYVDRSALSRELSRMQQEGILTYQGSVFHILDRSFLQN